jgi:hypothetical protein
LMIINRSVDFSQKNRGKHACMCNLIMSSANNISNKLE